MKRQTSVNENVRAILVDWIINVHMKFKLLPETLFLTINLIDRYLSLEVIDKSDA
jgi:cyclin B